MSKPSHKHKTVCVIGPSRLHDELIARCLEAQDDAECIAATSLEEARAQLGDIYSRIKLVLWHCVEKDVAREIKVLKSVEGLMPRNSTLGPFNVQRRQ